MVEDSSLHDADNSSESQYSDPPVETSESVKSFLVQAIDFAALSQ